MTPRTRVLIWSVFTLAVLAAGTVLYFSFRGQRPVPPLRAIEGVVIMASENPHRQAPINNVDITATAHGYTTGTRSEASGRFHLPMAREWKRGESITVTFRAENFVPLQETMVPNDDLFIARLQAAERVRTGDEPAQKIVPVAITNTRIRYSTEFLNTTNVGSIAPTMDVANTGNVACEGDDDVCSPDGKWKASIVSKTLDAGADNQFVNTRVSCIAGPCPFTSIEDDNYLKPARIKTIRVRNWSDTATFLIESEVSRTQRSNFVREAFPAIFGQAMTFTMPAGAQGLSVQADLNGTLIIFPMGPLHRLSWASCAVENPADGSQLYRCELKPGYYFQ